MQVLIVSLVSFIFCLTVAIATVNCQSAGNLTNPVMRLNLNNTNIRVQIVRKLNNFLVQFRQREHKTFLPVQEKDLQRAFKKTIDPRSRILYKFFFQLTAPKRFRNKANSNVYELHNCTAMVRTFGALNRADQLVDLTCKLAEIATVPTQATTTTTTTTTPRTPRPR